MLVDTERNASDHLPQILQNIQLALDIPIEKDNPYLDCLPLIAFGRQKRIELLKIYIENKNFEGVVFIDVATDMVNDFNSINETYEFYDYLYTIMEGRKVSFVIVIHENPCMADNKARGHLGTESKNKATIAVSVQRENMQVKIKFQKSRHYRDPPEFYMEYDENTKLLK